MALSWIFPRAFTSPPSVAPDGAYSYFDGALLHYDLEHTSEKYVSRTLFKAGNKYTGNGRAGIAVPPYHYHPYQDEHFEVRNGTFCYIVNGKEGTLQKGESLMSPAGDRHTFWCPAAAKEDLDVVVTASGPNGPGSFDEAFMHNFYGYLSACAMANRSINPIQVLRFLDNANVILADVPFGLGWLLNIVVGEWRFLGAYVAGYQTRYPEFERDTKKFE